MQSSYYSTFRSSMVTCTGSLLPVDLHVSAGHSKIYNGILGLYLMPCYVATRVSVLVPGRESTCSFRDCQSPDGLAGGRAGAVWAVCGAVPVLWVRCGGLVSEPGECCSAKLEKRHQHHPILSDECLRAFCAC